MILKEGFLPGLFCIYFNSTTRFHEDVVLRLKLFYATQNIFA